MRKSLTALLAGAALSVVALPFAALPLTAAPAAAFELGIVAFQMSSETHARVANAAQAAAEAKGWTVTVLNSGGTMPSHVEQLETLVQKGVDGIVVAMGKPRSEEHTSELQSLMRNSYTVFCLEKKK